jgi:ABC-type molybdate transport system ATPase subunit
LKKTNKTVLLATHNLPFALRVTDRVLHLREGRVTSSLPENIFEGLREGHVVVLGTGLSIELPPDVAQSGKTGENPVTIAIDPQNIDLSLVPQSTTQTNQFRGRISAIQEKGDDVWLKVDCGRGLTAIISRVSYEEQGFNLHKEVFVSFGSHDVEVLSSPRREET